MYLVLRTEGRHSHKFSTFTIENYAQKRKKNHLSSHIPRLSVIRVTISFSISAGTPQQT
jgi:hypothetical protein